jgi:hypothetical protein
LINSAIGILLKTQWLFTGFLGETKSRRISFITMPGQKSPNHLLHLTAEAGPI